MSRCRAEHSEAVDGRSTPGSPSWSLRVRGKCIWPAFGDRSPTKRDATPVRNRTVSRRKRKASALPSMIGLKAPSEDRTRAATASAYVGAASRAVAGTTRGEPSPVGDRTCCCRGRGKSRTGGCIMRGSVSAAFNARGRSFGTTGTPPLRNRSGFSAGLRRRTTMRWRATCSGLFRRKLGISLNVNTDLGERER